MTDRIFQQYAQGYGSTPCQVVCQIDGNTVFNGSVATLDEPLPSMPNPEFNVENIAWSWTNDAEFSGTQSISIAVTGSALLLAGTLANNPAGNAESYSAFYVQTINGVDYADPFSNEAIDGVAQSGPFNPDYAGQWWWVIPAGRTFTAAMHIDAPPPAPPSP